MYKGNAYHADEKAAALLVALATLNMADPDHIAVAGYVLRQLGKLNIDSDAVAIGDELEQINQQFLKMKSAESDRVANLIKTSGDVGPNRDSSDEELLALDVNTDGLSAAVEKSAGAWPQDDRLRQKPSDAPCLNAAPESILKGERDPQDVKFRNPFFVARNVSLFSRD